MFMQSISLKQFYILISPPSPKMIHNCQTVLFWLVLKFLSAILEVDSECILFNVQQPPLMLPVNYCLVSLGCQTPWRKGIISAPCQEELGSRADLPFLLASSSVWVTHYSLNVGMDEVSLHPQYELRVWLCF